MPSHKKGLASCGHLRAGLPYKLLQDHIKSTSQRAGRLMVASSFSFTSFSGGKPRKATRDLRIAYSLNLLANSLVSAGYELSRLTDIAEKELQ